MLQLPFPRPGILFAVILSDGRNPGNISDSRYSAPCGGNYWDSGPSTWISLSKKKKTAMYFMVIMVLIPLLIVFFDLLL